MTDTIDNLPATRQVSLAMLPVEVMRPVLDEYATRRAAFREWLWSQMQEGVHYGVPPGCEPKRGRNGEVLDFKGNVIDQKQWKHRPVLYKAGAQLLCDLLCLRPVFDVDQVCTGAMGGDARTIVMHCRLLKEASPFFPDRAVGDTIGEGRGAGSVGDKRRDANAAIKVAQKCALVDAVITATAIADLFTAEQPEPEPIEKPAAAADAPVVPTRDERAVAVTGAMLNKLLDRFRIRIPKANIQAFAEFARATLRSDADFTRPQAWTIDAYTAVEEALR